MGTTPLDLISVEDIGEIASLVFLNKVQYENKTISLCHIISLYLVSHHDLISYILRDSYGYDASRPDQRRGHRRKGQHCVPEQGHIREQYHQPVSLHVLISYILRNPYGYDPSRPGQRRRHR